MIFYSFALEPLILVVLAPPIPDVLPKFVPRASMKFGPRTQSPITLQRSTKILYSRLLTLQQARCYFFPIQSQLLILAVVMHSAMHPCITRLSIKRSGMGCMKLMKSYEFMPSIPTQVSSVESDPLIFLHKCTNNSFTDPLVVLVLFSLQLPSSQQS